MYRHIHILVAEDDQSDAFLLKRAFSKAGVNVPLQFVGHGQEAVEYLSGSGRYSDRAEFPLPQLFMLDLKMPGMDGFMVLRWLRRQPGLLRLPVIVLSSSADPHDVDLAHELGANGYTVKPGATESLEELVKGVEGYWLRQHRYPSLAPPPAGAVN